MYCECEMLKPVLAFLWGRSSLGDTEIRALERHRNIHQNTTLTWHNTNTQHKTWGDLYVCLCLRMNFPYFCCSSSTCSCVISDQFLGAGCLCCKIYFKCITKLLKVDVYASLNQKYLIDVFDDQLQAVGVAVNLLTSPQIFLFLTKMKKKEILMKKIVHVCKDCHVCHCCMFLLFFFFEDMQEVMVWLQPFFKTCSYSIET